VARRVGHNLKLAAAVAGAHLLAALILAVGYEPTSVVSRAELDTAKGDKAAEPALHESEASPASLAPEISAEPAPTAEPAPFAEPMRTP